MGRIPQDWTDCPKMGEGLVNDSFLVFKTPLTQNLNKIIGPHKQFTLEHVFKEVERLQKDKVLWIDLTNTTRYYPSTQVTLKGFTYLKLAMSGHGLPPSDSDKSRFTTAVDKFLNLNPGGLIAVHCTHGFNRTGFLISYYLIDKKGFTAPAAITEFSRVRAPGIYRKNYVETLYEIWKEKAIEAGESAEDLPPIPITPDPYWLNKSEQKPSNALSSDRQQQEEESVNFNDYSYDQYPPQYGYQNNYYYDQFTNDGPWEWYPQQQSSYGNYQGGGRPQQYTNRYQPYADNRESYGRYNNQNNPRAPRGRISRIREQTSDYPAPERIPPPAKNFSRY